MNIFQGLLLAAQVVAFFGAFAMVVATVLSAMDKGYQPGGEDAGVGLTHITGGGAVLIFGAAALFAQAHIIDGKGVTEASIFLALWGSLTIAFAVAYNARFETYLIGLTLGTPAIRRPVGFWTLVLLAMGVVSCVNGIVGGLGLAQ